MKNLKLDKTKSERSLFQELFFPVLLFILTIGAAGAAGVYFRHTSNMQSVDLLRQSARRAVVQCYAIEGNYPADVEYLEQNYGLEYNHDKYFIDYQIFASNVMPDLEVYERK